jgi:hypothetical protein
MKERVRKDSCSGGKSNIRMKVNREDEPTGKKAVTRETVIETGDEV